MKISTKLLLNKEWLILIVLVLIVHLSFLGIFPPAGVTGIAGRYVTAVCAIITTFLLSWYMYLLSKNKKLSFWVAFVLTTTPWFIEQSRIISPPLWALTVILGGLIFAQYWQSQKQRFFIMICTGILLAFIYPQIFFFVRLEKTTPISLYLGNIFKLISGEFLFFKNDSYWSGGLRNFGIFLPLSIVPLLVGVVEVISRFRKKYIAWLIPPLAIIIITALHPLFPETRFYLFMLPYLVILCGLGFDSMWKKMFEKSLITKICIAMWVCAFMYQSIIFVHFYVTHYSSRISQEIPYENRIF